MSRSEPVPLDPTGADRHAEDAALHAGGPAVPVDLLGVTAWAVNDPDVLRQLLTDHRVSKDPVQHWPPYPEEIVGRWPLDLWVTTANMFTAYGGDHRRLRRLVAPAFSTRRVNALLPRVQRITEDLLDAIAAAPRDEPVDLRERLAYPLPIRVISELMGLPPELGDDFRRTVYGVFDTTLDIERATANNAELHGLLHTLVAGKRADPGDDMTSVLIAARDEEGDGSTLTEDELVDTLLLVVSAGHETTTNLLDQAITALLTHPEQLALVRAGEVGWGEVIEEALRFEAPVAYLPLRFAVSDIPLPGGVVIRQGDPILAAYAAAGRHPRIHGASAERFDITRANKEHLAFGHGAHFCLGAPLARAEAAIALPALFDRFPGIRLAVPAEELRSTASMISNGHLTLPVHPHPA
ncbi:cytochrome P450 family protein [Streptomyces profundus]|uniref:cytochrome P450 family protein n=1 Tax=Streptomyces profundus TaxID=2867410 RepID=UPI001D1650C2|nr:cytochrome P450 [Streptomyces sp. MA3_2.13]UED83307.1 cytochrome P450 [Streptomyces sp. MA3_2.13]